MTKVVKEEKPVKEKKEKRDKEIKKEKKHKSDKKEKKEKKDKKDKKEKKEPKPEAEPVKEVKSDVWHPRQLFISGLPYETNEEQLMEFFANEKESIKEVKMPKYQDSGRCIGYAHILLSEQKAYEAALAKSGQKMGARYLDIKAASGSNSGGGVSAPPQVDNMPADCKTLFVKNLPYNMQEDDIGDRFRQFGEVANIRIAYNWQTNQSKGFAYVEYAQHASAKTALAKMHGKMILGRAIAIDFDVSKTGAKSSYKPPQESERNRLYNRESLREEQKKHFRKEKDKKRVEMIKKQ